MAQPAAFLRRHLFVDTGVQSALLRRLLLYAAGCLTYFIGITVVDELLLHRDRGFAATLLGCLDQIVYWAPGLMLLVPIFLYDLLRVTNRFAGPMYSLSREMKRVAGGGVGRSLRFRDGDHWGDMAVAFNQIREELLTLREKVGVEEPEAIEESSGLRRQLFEPDGDGADSEF